MKKIQNSSFLILSLRILSLLAFITGCQSNQSMSTSPAYPIPSDEQEIVGLQSKASPTNISLDAFLSFLPSGEDGSEKALSLLFITSLGLLLGVIYGNTKSLLPTFLIHAVNNL